MLPLYLGMRANHNRTINKPEVAAQLLAWAERDRTGKAADSSTGYALPNGATRCPDASWISMERLKKPAKIVSMASSRLP